jgi:hypothetical protein
MAKTERSIDKARRCTLSNETVPICIPMDCKLRGLYIPASQYQLSFIILLTTQVCRQTHRSNGIMTWAIIYQPMLLISQQSILGIGILQIMMYPVIQIWFGLLANIHSMLVHYPFSLLYRIFCHMSLKIISLTHFWSRAYCKAFAPKRIHHTKRLTLC